MNNATLRGGWLTQSGTGSALQKPRKFGAGLG